MKNKYFHVLSALIIIVLLSSGCSSFQNILNTLENVRRLKFKLYNIDNFNLCGVNLSSKVQISDFSFSEAAIITSSFASNKLPAQFVLNVEAVNPNDGSGGSQQTSATLTSFEWALYIDNAETVKGNVNEPIEIPGRGSSTIIPLTISIDLYEFFASKSYEGIVNIALALGGVSSSPARLKLIARPKVSTIFGELYMGTVTITDKEFSN